MALFDTDWTNELNQVHEVAKKIIDDDVSPMIDKKVDSINEYADELMRKLTLQADLLAKEMLKAIELQRQKLVADITKIALILLLGFTVSGAVLIWLVFMLNNGFNG